MENNALFLTVVQFFQLPSIIKILFIVLSLAAALLLPIKRLTEVKGCTYLPGLRDPALRGSRLSLSIIHSIRQGIDHQF